MSRSFNNYKTCYLKKKFLYSFMFVCLNLVIMSTSHSFICQLWIAMATLLFEWFGISIQQASSALLWQSKSNSYCSKSCLPWNDKPSRDWLSFCQGKVATRSFQTSCKIKVSACRFPLPLKSFPSFFSKLNMFNIYHAKLMDSIKLEKSCSTSVYLFNK